jgi:UDP-glucose 4-epimerase
MSILVTGGMGYIGSHAVVLLLQQGYDVIIVDNLSNSSGNVLERITLLSDKPPTFYKEDICDEVALERIFCNHTIDTVMHFAGLKAVGESVVKPLAYFYNNVKGTLCLLNKMAQHRVNNIIFSSSATVYAQSNQMPLNENAYVGNTTNPYGTSKWMVEVILKDYCCANPNFSAISLRYFNPIGAHPSGMLGESPTDLPNNLMPYITQVAIGKLSYLSIYGNDYPTPDGTGLRDYIHVMDLSQGHIDVVNLLKNKTNMGFKAYNLGTGQAYSVLDMVNTFEKINHVKIPYKIVPRRTGDVAACWADASAAKKELKWQAKYNLNDMLIDSWNWQVKNPKGYAS